MIKNKINIGIIEDDPNYRNTLRKIISAQTHMELKFDTDRANKLFDLLENYYIDILIVDIRLPDADGSELMRKIKQQVPEVKCLMCTTFMDTDLIVNSLKNGADGYVIKTDSLENIIQAINDVYKGSAYMSKMIAIKLVDYFHKQGSDTNELDCLTNRENQVLALISEGKLYKEVADILSLSIDTVKKHVSHIYKKLEVSNKTEAINIYNNQTTKSKQL